MKEKILKFYYINMTSIKCSPLLFKHKRILRTVFSMTFSEISGVILLISMMMLFFNSWRVLVTIKHIDVSLSFKISP